jgi:phosphoglycolate phosphatase
MKNHFVLFDLDGTITDSSEGIINSIQYALKKMGKEENDRDRLRSYVGPSLKHTFLTHYFPEGKEYEKAIVFYRKYYSEKGIFENRLYDGITNVFADILRQGGKIALATAKPTYFAKIILRHFGIIDKFETIVGSHLNGTRTSKNEIIFEVLDQFGFPNSDNIFMIGDREYDVFGGKFHNLKTIGVKYGYAPFGELENAKPDHIIFSTKEIMDCL